MPTRHVLQLLCKSTQPKSQNAVQQASNWLLTLLLGCVPEQAARKVTACAAATAAYSEWGQPALSQADLQVHPHEKHVLQRSELEP